MTVKRHEKDTLKVVPSMRLENILNTVKAMKGPQVVARRPTFLKPDAHKKSDPMALSTLNMALSPSKSAESAA